MTVNPTVLPAMVAAVTARASSDRTFRAQVNAAALRALTLKANQGLLGGRLTTSGQLEPLTTTALQRWLGIAHSGQMTAATIRALQARIGNLCGWHLGTELVATLQSYLGTFRDNARTWNTRTVSLLQRYLNTQL